MKKLITMLLLVAGIMALAGCKTVDPVDVDCTLNPEHEDCAEVDFCELHPDDATCNMMYTFEDSYDLLDIENDQVDDFETVFNLMNNLVSVSSELFDVAKDNQFASFYSNRVNSDTGLTEEELNNYSYPKDILLAGIDKVNFSITSEVSHFEINFEDDVFVEDAVIEALITEYYNGRSRIMVNENSFHYMYEVEAVNTPGEIVSYYEMTVVITERNRLVVEFVEFNTSEDGEFDLSYLIYDSEVGYIMKDLKYYNESLVFFEDKVDLNENTAEMKEINLGGYRTYTYSMYDNDDEFYYRKTNTQSQIGNYYEMNKISFLDEFHEMVSLEQVSEFVTDTYVPSNYHLSYNISYLSGWDIVYQDYLIKNNSKLAYVSSGGINSIAHSFMVAEMDFDQFPLENEFTTPYSGLVFSGITYAELVSEMNSLSAMTNPVYYDQNIATVEGVTYNIQTDLLDLFISDLPQIVNNRIMDNMFLDDISFGGEDALIDLIDCDVTPEHRLCPSPE